MATMTPDDDFASYKMPSTPQRAPASIPRPAEHVVPPGWQVPPSSGSSGQAPGLPYELRDEDSLGRGYMKTRGSLPAISITDESEPDDSDLAFNRTLEANDLLKQMGFKGDSIYHDGAMIRIFCPIHHDQIRRSMIINPQERSYRCSLKTCRGNRGGTLLELYALVKDISVTEARRRMSTGKTSLYAVPEQSLVDDAQDLIEKGDYEAALPLLMQAVELSPKNETTRCRLAALQLEMGHRDDGISNYLVSAEDYGVRGELDKTLQIYNLLVLMSPNDYDIHEQMAYIAVRLGNTEDALQKLKWITNALIEQDQFNDALLRVNRMLELAPDNTDFLLLKADLLAAAGHPETAAQHVALCVQQLAARNMLAGAYRMAQKGIEIDPSNQLLAVLYQEVGAGLRKLGLDLDQLKALGDDAAASDEEGDFLDWIGSLEDDVIAPPDRGQQAEATTSEALQALPTDAVPPASGRHGAITGTGDFAMPTTGEFRMDDALVAMCKDNLVGSTPDDLKRMLDHLRGMYAEVKRCHEDGALSDFEKKVITNFYKSFCKAFKDYDTASGTDLLTRF